jgi:Flp pilus assembly protein TadG
VVRAQGPGRDRGSPPRSGGQALVEFAFVVIILITVVFAIIDFGIYLFKTVTLNHAVRSGVRLASLNNSTRAQIRTEIKNSAVGVEISDTEISITTDAKDDAIASAPPTVTVTVLIMHTFYASALYQFQALRVLSTAKAIVTTHPIKPLITF